MLINIHSLIVSHHPLAVDTVTATIDDDWREHALTLALCL